MTAYDIRSYDICERKGLKAQRFFLGNTLWIRIVEVNGEDVKFLVYWNLSDEINHVSWEYMIYQLAGILSKPYKEYELTDQYFKMDHKGWDCWSLGTPTPIAGSGINYDLDDQALLPATSKVDLPNK